LERVIEHGVHWYVSALSFQAPSESARVTALRPTSVEFQMFVCANIIQLMDLLYDLLIERQYIGRLDVRRFVLFEKE
jgi:hypothetical protein